MTYFIVKWLHVLGATLLFGTGLGIAFFLWIAHRRGDVHAIAQTARTVVIADAVFTAPAVLLQLGTGLWLMHYLGYSFELAWLRLAFVLYLVVGACWLPVLRLQLRARDLALAAAANRTPLPPAYHRAMRWWFWLGWPAFLGVIAIFWLMVRKPL